MSETLFLSCDAIGSIVQKIGADVVMDELIDRLDIALGEFDQESFEVPPRDGFRYDQPHTGLVEWMPLMRRGSCVTLKMVGYHPQNPISYQLPTILSTLSLFDVRTGHMKVLADGSFLTCLRTGAASAVASRILADAESRVLGLIGAGAQSMSQLYALAETRATERVAATYFELQHQSILALDFPHLLEFG